MATRANDQTPSPGRPRGSGKGEQTRARLIAAARTLLAGESAGRFTTRNVAALCGLSHGMCHYHFQDRTDLIVAVIEDIRPEWITPLEEAVAGPGRFAERAERVIALLTRPESPDLAHLHAALHWLALNDERVRAGLEEEYRRWRACFVRLFQVLADERADERAEESGREGGGDAELDPRLLGESFAAAVDGLAAFQSLEPELAAEAVLRALMASLAAGA
ncbi:TetR/AcrR family transcriptional regulator [Kitasatospora sp. LaBMicrA B282]|uniref:TetR/AcrR family transcriptional regulator n=1 Tax=Kitasatospora sp. LaBMicrA B282 TaxID=3420949 RepID=UPI003D0CF471